MTDYNVLFIKSCIQETLNILTDAESRTNTILKRLQKKLWRGYMIFVRIFFVGRLRNFFSFFSFLVALILVFVVVVVGGRGPGDGGGVDQ